MMKYKLVTFDIFDTLVHRRLRAPVDVFEAVRLSVMQKKVALRKHDILASFTHDRIRAEAEARENFAKATGGEGEVNFAEIYDRYEEVSGCGKDLRLLLESAELELEKAFLFASAAGLEMFHEMKLSAEQVGFISDMYLPSDWLSAMLEEKGFEGASQLPIFVSGEYRKSKHRGTLYPEVARALAVAPSSKWLHIGDNQHSDIAKAREYSISTKFADWAKVDNRRLVSDAPQREYFVRSIIDFVQMPQSRHFLPDDEYASVGYTVFGPLIFGFMMWVIARTKEADLKRLAFIARDGWLPHQLFELLKVQAGLGDVSSSYIHFSRRVGLQIGLKEWDIDQLWAAFGGKVPRPIEECLATLGYDANSMGPLLERFGFEVGSPVGEGRRSAAHMLATTTFNRGLRSSSAQREKFKKYFEGHFLPGEKTGLVDIGWNGNIQRYLISALDSRYMKDQFMGLYLGLHSSAYPNRDRGLVLEGWMSDFGRIPHVQEYLLSGGVELLEFALTSDHGTALGFTENNEGNVVPVLEELLPDEASYREKAMKVQTGIRKFVEDNRYLLHYYDPALLSHTAWAAPFERLVNDPTQDELRLLAGLTHSDTAGVTSSRLVLAARQNDKTRKSKRLMALAREEAFWKVAFDRLNS
jgi:predicted HAD superfamily hydrolase